MTGALLARHRYPLQVALVAVATVAFVLLADAFAFRSPVNLLWMFGMPMMVAVLANTGWDRRCFMLLALLGVVLVTGIFVGVQFTSYG